MTYSVFGEMLNLTQPQLGPFRRPDAIYKVTAGEVEVWYAYIGNGS